MNKNYVLMVILGSFIIHCLKSDILGSFDHLDDYGCDMQAQSSMTRARDPIIYPIPVIPKQDRMYNPGQPLGEVLRETGNYVLTSACEVAKGVGDGTDESMLKRLEQMSKTITTSLEALTSRQAMQGDTGMSVAQLIQAGNLIAAQQHWQSLKKTRRSDDDDDVVAVKTCEQRAYDEVEDILKQLREHDDLVQKELWRVLERKIKKNKELLTRLSLIVGALENGTVRTLENNGFDGIDLLQEARQALLTMYRSNALFIDRASQEAASFEQLFAHLDQKIETIEARVKPKTEALAAAAHSTEKAVRK